MKRFLPILIALFLAGCGGQSDAARATAPAPPASAAQPAPSADVLRSWNDGPAKRAIVDFVARVTWDGGPDFVPVAERIATFDNDGTLWA
jgi:hypothetical protein